MSRQQQGLGQDFDLLSQPMQQRLQERVAERNNNVAAVQQEVEAQLAELDRHGEPLDRTARRRYQAQRALLVAQPTFLVTLKNTLHAHEAQRNQQVIPWYRARRS